MGKVSLVDDGMYRRINLKKTQGNVWRTVFLKRQAPSNCAEVESLVRRVVPESPLGQRAE